MFIIRVLILYGILSSRLFFIVLFSVLGSNFKNIYTNI